jgi:hypothetical protein
MGQLLTSADRPDSLLTSLRRAFFVGDCLIKRDVLKLKKFAPNVHCVNVRRRTGETDSKHLNSYFCVSDVWLH